MDSFQNIERDLAATFLAGDLKADAMVKRAQALFGKKWKWVELLAIRVEVGFAGKDRPRLKKLECLLAKAPVFLKAINRCNFKYDSPEPTMAPVSAAKQWKLPPICTPGELADWLWLSPNELDWFADLRSLEAKHNRQRLRHYRYRPLTKRFGQIRMIEAPKERLKKIQHRILSEIIEAIPPHAAAHGFRRGRSIASFASPHVGKRIVVRIDLQDFFPSISATRIQALFRTAGYPELVADLLAGCTTNATPREAWPRDSDFTNAKQKRQAEQQRRLYTVPHVPQGAPTSPAIANLCAYRMDCRLAAFAKSVGADYTRYADDCAFSGGHDFARIAKRFHYHVCAIVMEEGFAVHHYKTKFMKQGVQQKLCGLIVNQRLNIPRQEYDRLKATLTNCIRHGSASQNRTGHEDFRQHLQGRIAFIKMVHPNRGERLGKLFEKVLW